MQLAVAVVLAVSSHSNNYSNTFSYGCMVYILPIFKLAS